jgi:3',5'-cyclic AMP phosphodiesterase CpdA
VLIAQLSDPHIRPRGELYQGVVDSNRGFAAAIQHVLALDTRPDLMLITGDLVDEGRPDEYAMVRDILAALPIPQLVIPGNHDDRACLRTAFADHGYLPSCGPLHYCVDDYPVRIIGLDSTIPGQHHGHLDQPGLDWLADTLAEKPDKPTVVMLHHPPVVSGIPYLDEYRYFDEPSLRGVVGRFGNVEAVLCGHVHRPMVKRWAGTVLCTSPSTATQIDLKFAAAAGPSSHDGPRGYLLHSWSEGDGLVSHTVQLGTFGGPYPFA